MAAPQGIVELTEMIFDQTGLALDERFAERVRQLGDSACKAGIEATIKYLSERSELSESELQMLSAGNIPEHVKQRDFEAHIERLNRQTDLKPDERDRRMF